MREGVYAAGGQRDYRSLGVGGLLLLLLPAAWLVLSVGGEAALLPYSTIRVEAFVLDGVMTLAAGQELYPEVDTSSTIFHVYNPFAYLLPGVAGALLSLSPETMLWVGRVSSIIASLGLSAALALWALRRFPNRQAALLVAMLPLFFNELLLTHFFRLRPESAALLFSALALVLVDRSDLSKKTLAASALCCLVAFGFKQSFVVVPVVVTLHLLLNRDYAKALRFAAYYALGIAAFYLVMVSWFGAGFVDHTLFAMASNDVYPLAAVSVYGPYFAKYAGGLLAASLVAFCWLALRWRTHQLLLLFWLLALAWNLYASGKAGSSSNYFAEFGLASLLLVISALFSPDSGRRWESLFAALMLLPLLLHAGWEAGHGYAQVSPRVSRDDPGVDYSPYLKRYRDASNDLILNEKLAIQLGNPQGFDWFLLDLRSRHGKFDMSALVDRIRRAEYRRIVFPAKPTSGIERRLYQVVAKAGYRQVFRDRLVIEWQRSRAP